MSTQINCIGFDPAYAKPTAWAYKAPLDWAAESTTTKADSAPNFTESLNVLASTNATHWVCENVYMGRNPAVMAGLARVQGNIEAAATQAGREFVLVNTSTWAKILPDKIGGGRRRKRADIIAGAILFARDLTGRDDLSEDESVAVCISHWGNENLKAEGE